MSQNQDAEMTEAAPIDGDTPAESPDEEEAAGEEEPILQLIRTLPGSDPLGGQASYEFLNEDHTLGNALRHIIMKNPDVEFCGYSIPHPAEAKMHIRIQTFEGQGVSTLDVLEKGLDDLMDLCDVVVEKFEAAQKEFHGNVATET